jgi:outer membrane protein assembly factor BamB
MKYLLTMGVLFAAATVQAQNPAPWSTYRGNPQRTGNVDGKPGPEKPKVLFARKMKDHFIASPVPVQDRLFVSGLGPFNIANFYAMSAQPKSSKEILYTKSTPYLKIPTVSSPGVMAGKLVFGDGMHQNDGATLHCIDLASGLPVWQLPVPGKLVHLEGSPTLTDDRVYIGGGSAGVLCVSFDQITLEGKKVTLPEVQKIVAQRWKDLQAQYEVDKKKDPDFAVPPTEDQLPKAKPNQLWQAGKDKWHVDGPLNLIGKDLLMTSAFLDLERVGDRSIACLAADNGEVRWRAPLKYNPWGGASVVGKTVIVTSSSIGYYPGMLKGAKGMVSAFDLTTGKPQWSKDVTGGVVGCAALADGAAVVTATDGKVRAFDLATGERRWIYEAKTPLFAPPAVAGNVVYAGDFNGVVHAIDLKSGTGRWTFDLGTHPEVQSPGMVYGGPVVDGGRVYVTTCNLEGPHAQKGTVVVCLGE